MHDERGERGGDRPLGQLRGFDDDAALLEKAFDQENGADGNEDVFAEEESDIVDGSSVGANVESRLVRQRSMLLFSGRFGHGREKWPHHLRVTAEGGLSQS